MGTTKKYWAGIEELHEKPSFLESQKKEFNEEIPTEEFLADNGLSTSTTGRRDFLKFLGFSVAAATLSACETPVIKSIPYLTKPEEVTPGMPTWYASSYYDGQDFASILVKTREGRPIFIKGNKKYGWFGGGINARINSSVLSLYDNQRLKHPIKDNEEISWSQADNEIMAALKSAKENGKQVRVLTNTIISPTTKYAISELLYGINGDEGTNAQQISYDSVSYSGIRKANKEDFDKNVIPSYHFEKAHTIVSISADFLDGWLMSTDYMVQYGKARNPENKWMARHYQFETLLSLTGSNADYRLAIKPSEEGLVAASIYNRIAKKSGAKTLNIDTSAVDEHTEAVANELFENKGKSIVVAGSNEVAIQKIVNGINVLLDNYGEIIDVDNPIYTYQGNEQETRALVAEMKTGKVDVLLIYGANPVYTLPHPQHFIEGLNNVKTTVYFGLYNDETGTNCKYVLPDNHYLESWNDLSPAEGKMALVQPVISPLFNTRQAQESFLKWNGNNSGYYDVMRQSWQYYIPEEIGSSDKIWNKSLLRGTYISGNNPYGPLEYAPNLSGSVSRVNKLASSGGDWQIVLYKKTGIGDGSSANNPWLQELPDPITKVTWDNYVTLSLADAQKFGVNIYLGEKDPASMAMVSIDGYEVVLPVVPVPGQKSGTLGIAIGYGRGANGERVGRAAFQTDGNGEHIMIDGKPQPVGQNAYPFATFDNGLHFVNYNADFNLLEDTYPIALTQTQHTIMDRDSVLRETTLDIYKSGDKNAYNEPHTIAVHEGGKTVHKPVREIDLWEDQPVEGVGHRWGMSIDLTTCTGCSICVTACHSENNVPVVGKDEVRRARDMHWMRIDRYFTSDMNKEKAAEQGLGDVEMYALMEVPSNSPRTVHMPMMCQHCNHAPCETVCPVLATTHSFEGLNQMTYNRCIGTRYCANNCPYKVRRFNWFNYNGYSKFAEVNPAQDSFSRMVLNPDVVVRSRGVMEKCSMCIQRIQSGKLDAKKAGTPVKDGAIETACAEACPTNAIRFGDLNDKQTVVRTNTHNDRAYLALEEVGIQPNVYYMTKVRNIENNNEQNA
jgi:molybdopterin-containing oxidoreductase family iron-sulfur binding subunit